MFTAAMIEAARIEPGEVPELQCIVVAVDLADGETGIVVGAKGEDGHGYVLAEGFWGGRQGEL